MSQYNTKIGPFDTLNQKYLYRIVRYYGYTIFPLICPFNATLVSNIGNTKTLAVRDFTHLDNCLLIYRHYARRLLPKLSTDESS